MLLIEMEYSIIRKYHKQQHAQRTLYPQISIGVQFDFVIIVNIICNASEDSIISSYW